MGISPNTQRRVAYVDIMTDHAFSRSVSHWRLPSESKSRWSEVNSQTKTVLFDGKEALIIDCNSDATISAPEGGVIHVNGDLNADLDCAGNLEIVIQGNVSRNSIIRANGFFHIYIGGSIYGRIVSQDSGKIWCDGNHLGDIATGHPSMNLHITGDCVGSIVPKGKASLLYLCVDGFMKNESISNIAAIGYTVFNATIGFGDVEPGLYPIGIGCRITDTGYSHSRWCVQTQRR